MEIIKDTKTTGPNPQGDAMLEPAEEIEGLVISEDEDVLLGSQHESLGGAQKVPKEGAKPPEGTSLGIPN